MISHPSLAGAAIAVLALAAGCTSAPTAMEHVSPRTESAVLAASSSPALAGDLPSPQSLTDTDQPTIGECAWRPAPQPSAADPHWQGANPGSHVLMVNYCNGPRQYQIVPRAAVPTADSSNGHLPASPAHRTPGRACTIGGPR